MKRLILLIVCVTIIVLLVTGCGSKSVETSQILLDLEKIDFSGYTFSSQFTNNSEYSYSPEKIIKRQTNLENKEDIVFYEVLANNDYFQLNLTVKLVYNYYDEGGWILDEHYIERTDVTPKSYPEKDLIISYLQSENVAFNYFDSTKLNYTQNNNLIHFNKSVVNIDWNSLDGANNNANLNITAYLDNDIAIIAGNIDLHFDEDNGWTFFKDGKRSALNIVSKEFNFSNECTGRYKCRLETAWGYVYVNEYQIYNVNTETEEIETNEGSIAVDPLTVNGFMTYNNSKPYMYYSTYDDTWNFGEQKYKKVN